MPQQLPNELKIQIIRLVDRESLPSVLRVNSTFHEIGVPILYHTIILRPLCPTSQATATKLLNTINERPEAARAVHSMGVNLFDSNPFSRFYDIGVKQFFEAFRMALPKIVNLQKLEISDLGIMGKAYIAQFPRGFRVSALKHYVGPPDTLDYIQSSVLRTLFIEDRERSIPAISSALLTAAQLSGQTLKALWVRSGDSESEWDGLYKDIPSLFPNLRSLNLEPWHDISFVRVIFSSLPAH
ncbi:hypothetical protein FS837_007340 [Tulasnella sp. UAMH 9824]|nr:hypothetical protein FS837_007340 [Tulasnella sp. UAMH 9824]